MKSHHLLALLTLIPISILLYMIYSNNHFMHTAEHTDRKEKHSTHHEHVLHNVVPQTRSTTQKTEDTTVDREFMQYVTERTDGTGTVYVAVVDTAHQEMALNLYYTVLKTLGISNYLFIGGDKKVCRTLKRKSISCYPKFNHKNFSDASIYKTQEFNQKTQFKSIVVHEILKMGINVLLLDNDIVLLKDPMPCLPCSDCDIHFQNDKSRANGGFYFAKATPASLEFFSRTTKVGSQFLDLMDDQDVFHYVLMNMVSVGALKVHILDRDVFAYGQHYFEDWQIMFHDDSHEHASKAVMYHNNWIIGKHAKIYRFKELLHWNVDTDGYYSSTNTKYLVYDNPFDFKEHSITQEITALKAAFSIGHITNRVVVLPTFSCNNCKYKACKDRGGKCPFNCHFRVQTLDEKLGPMYREHSFFDHPLVAVSVKESSCGHLIMVDVIKDHYEENRSDNIHKPSNSTAGATVEEIKQWFGSITLPVVRFHSLYGAFAGFTDDKDSAIAETMELIIDHNDNYMQYV